jgi:fatty-acyl-CoA synthase
VWRAVTVGARHLDQIVRIGVHHLKWDERPLPVMALKPGHAADKRDILATLKEKIAKWWMPDGVVFVGAIPHSVAGKVRKLVRRQRVAGYHLSG